LLVQLVRFCVDESYIAVEFLQDWFQRTVMTLVANSPKVPVVLKKAVRKGFEKGWEDMDGTENRTRNQPRH
jgi:hypothetical protein